MNLTILCLIIASYSLVESIERKTDKREFKLENELTLCDSRLYTKFIPIKCTCSPLQDRADCSLIHSNNTQWHLLQTIRTVEVLSFRIHVEKGSHSEREFITIPHQYLNDFPYLTKLEFRNSYIYVLPSYAFANLKYITDLTLFNNVIEIFSENAIGNMSHLRTLHIEYNRQGSINSNIFFNLPVLRKLNLTLNEIHSLSSYHFKSLPSLRILDLKKNLIRRVSQLKFAGISKLNHLDLSFNKLKTIQNDTFLMLSNLRTLKLSYNEIETLAPAAFKDLQQLVSLNLAGNRLVLLHSSTFQYLTRLFRLDLNGNRLVTISFEAIAPLYRNLMDYDNRHDKRLYLHDNNLKCDCSLAWMYPLAKKMHESGQTKAFQRTETVCYFQLTCINPLKCSAPFNTISSNTNYSEEYYLDLTKMKCTKCIVQSKEHINYKLASVHLPEIPVEALDCKSNTPTLTIGMLCYSALLILLMI